MHSFDLMVWSNDKDKGSKVDTSDVGDRPTFDGESQPLENEEQHIRRYLTDVVPTWVSTHLRFERLSTAAVRERHSLD